MAASSDIKRLFLRGIYATAQAGGQSLSEALNALALGSYTSTSSGKFITSTMAAGRKVDFIVPPAGRGLTPLEIGEVLAQLLDLYEVCDAALQTIPIASPTDAQLFAEIMDRLQPRRLVRATHTGDQYPYGYGYGFAQ